MARIRCWLADRLIATAYRLDPFRPSAKTNPAGGWIVNIGGVPLAHVSAGSVIDTTRFSR
jgi:hypothetical protein